MSESINPVSNLKEYFYREIEKLLNVGNTEAEPETLNYLSNLLYDYRRSDNLYDQNEDGRLLMPLAEYYRLALESPSRVERRLLLRKLGDVALFVSSFYRGSLRRKPVGIDYYMSMGEGAYASLADEARQPIQGSDVIVAYRELAENFSEYSSVLSCLKKDTSSNGSESHTKTLLDKIAEWEETACPRLELELREAGVVLVKPDPFADGVCVH